MQTKFLYSRQRGLFMFLISCLESFIMTVNGIAFYVVEWFNMDNFSGLSVLVFKYLF